jgi:hypothetical protein
MNFTVRFIGLFLRIVLVCLLPATVHAERAILECTSTKPAGDATLLDFRFAAVEGWKVEKATLLLHLAGGKMPRAVRVAPALEPARARRLAVRDYGEGWMEIVVPPELLQARNGVTVRGARIHARETVKYSPYLMVEGSR